MKIYLINKSYLVTIFNLIFSPRVIKGNNDLDLRRQYCWKDAYLTVPEGGKSPAFFIWICLTDRPACFFLWKVYTLGYSACVLGSRSYLLPNCQLEMLVLLAKAWVIVPRSVQSQRHIISYLLWEKAGFLSSYDQSLVWLKPLGQRRVW